MEDLTEIDWNEVEEAKKEGYTFTAYIEPSWTNKRYEYSEEETKMLLYWRKIDKKFQENLENFKQRGKQNIVNGNCPRCTQKLQGTWASCNCGTWFCEYCFEIMTGPKYTCKCREEEDKCYKKMAKATEEIMKIRRKEYDDWKKE